MRDLGGWVYTRRNVLGKIGARDMARAAFDEIKVLIGRGDFDQFEHRAL